MEPHWCSHLHASSINVLNLTGIAHVPPMRALRQFVTQVRHGDVRPISLNQAVNPVPPSPAALVALDVERLELADEVPEDGGSAKAPWAGEECRAAWWDGRLALGNS
jgi:hypothetical protein